MYYELMDLDSANVVGFFESKVDAFAAIRDAYERYGRSGIEDLALSEETADGNGALLGEGQELLKMAMDIFPRPEKGSSAMPATP